MRDIDFEAERQFENEKVSGNNPRLGQSKFYWATEPRISGFENQIAEKIRGKKILEIGCTYGLLTLELAKHADHVTGLDISDEGIRQATAKAAEMGVTNTTFVCGDAHALPFEDNSFDACVAISVLHHLDFDVAVNEIARVLKPEGELLSREPLGTNPVFQFYRMLTPSARTVDEQPLDKKNIRSLTNAFDISGSNFIGLTSVFAGLLRKVPGATQIRGLLLGLDGLLEKTLLKWMFWQITIVGRPRKR